MHAHIDGRVPTSECRVGGTLVDVMSATVCSGPSTQTLRHTSARQLVHMCSQVVHTHCQPVEMFVWVSNFTGRTRGKKKGMKKNTNKATKRRTTKIMQQEAKGKACVALCC